MLLRKLNEFNQMLLDFSTETVNDAIAELSFDELVTALVEGDDGNYVNYDWIKAGYY